VFDFKLDAAIEAACDGEVLIDKDTAAEFDLAEAFC
jgi:hypothetical protein